VEDLEISSYHRQDIYVGVTRQRNEQKTSLKEPYVYDGKGGHKDFRNLQKFLLYRWGKTYRGMSAAEHNLFMST
jgi:hypothetical protein